jgi:hypothetical protein
MMSVKQIRNKVIPQRLKCGASICENENIAIMSIDATQIQISKSKSQITKCQIPNPKFNLMCQIPNPKSQIFFLSAKSRIQVPNPKSQIILDLGSIYNYEQIFKLSMTMTKKQL